MNNLNILLFSFGLAIIPFLIVISTAYLKVNIVLNIFKNAIGVQQVPSGILIGTVSLAISLMVMQPVWSHSSSLLESGKFFDIKIEQQTVQELINQLSSAIIPWKQFVEKHAGTEEVAFLIGLQQGDKSLESKEKNNFFLMLTAFILSELKEAFQMGLMLLLPFLIIDFLIANLLAGLGMMMFSPVLLSLPLKIMLIVALDFWQLIFKALFLSYQ